ncbi:MAG TPA: molybdenum cofactor biosynthesis F family protein [Steroidobacteraceae bacterium]|nr:molybdenum cofactor biosynthesis F family protein [Steroidobacteraceae bacterium]
MSHAERAGPAAGRSWISVGALGEAFGADADSHILPPSSRLAGRRMTLRFEDGSALDYHFQSAAQLVDGTGRVESYRATEIRPGTLFVDLILSARRAATISLVLDLDRGVCTALESSLPEEAEAKVPLIERVARGADLTGVQAKFLSGTIDSPFGPGAVRHTHTRELIGRRIEYTYGRSERYEHVYLNEQFYTWHCLSGSEQGLADTDRCHHLKIADRLYLFVWREKIVPTLGAVVVDLQQMKTTGKILGYRSLDFGAVVNFPVGARARSVGAP